MQRRVRKLIAVGMPSFIGTRGGSLEPPTHICLRVPKHLSEAGITQGRPIAAGTADGGIARREAVGYARSAMRGGIYVLNFYSAVFVDQLKRGRKTATIRLGDKSNKYERGQVVWVTVGFRHSQREKIFTAEIRDLQGNPARHLTRPDIQHHN